MTDRSAWIWHDELLLKIPLHVLLTKAWFYLVHRALHASPFLYRHVHRVHHRFAAPTAMACVYAYPIEFVLGNIAPIWAGPILTNTHPATCCYLWFPLAMLGTCVGHCGYRIAGHADRHHDDYHLFFDWNFGGMYLSDYLLGTAREYRAEGEKKTV